jgi:hypothetical protein
MYQTASAAYLLQSQAAAARHQAWLQVLAVLAAWVPLLAALTKFCPCKLSQALWPVVA